MSSFRTEKLPPGFKSQKLELIGKASKGAGLLGAARQLISQQRAENEAGSC